MEEKLRNIISIFIKIPADQINSQTIIDRSAVNNSILLHRMYAKFADEGLVIQDYSAIKNFGNLLQKINVDKTEPAKADDVSFTNGIEILPARQNGSLNGHPGVGIDMEQVTAMPQADDFREDNFYKMNFSPSEISYCIIQSNPYESFAGLFAAKEAIVKADNGLKGKPFNAINIDHSPEGKPLFHGFHISISHAGDLAIAVALKDADAQVKMYSSPQTESRLEERPILSWTEIIALLVSAAALIIALWK